MLSMGAHEVRSYVAHATRNGGVKESWGKQTGAGGRQGGVHFGASTGVGPVSLRARYEPCVPAFFGPDTLPIT